MHFLQYAFIAFIPFLAPFIIDIWSYFSFRNVNNEFYYEFVAKGREFLKHVNN